MSVAELVLESNIREAGCIVSGSDVELEYIFKRIACSISTALDTAGEPQMP